MLVDVLLLTVGLYAAGGLAAASYVGVYTIVPVYAGIVLSSTACIVATVTATASYVAAALLQQGRWLPPTGVAPPNAWETAAFNLLILNVVGALTAVLANAYRYSRHRLAALYQELERAHDESLRLNTELQQTARLNVLGEVLSGVSHEIRNALQAVILPLNVIRQKLGEPAPDLRRHLDRVEHGANLAMRIITNVLQTARQSSTEKVAVSWAEVARRTVELKGYDLRRDGITMQLDFPRDFPLVVARPLQLQQVLLNLVTNAQDALRDGKRSKTIAIAGLTEPGRAVIEVRDTGPGIPPEAFPRLFEPLFTTKTHGTGLGLSISADIVRELGGQLTAANRADGGAVFRVSLPALPSAPAVIGAPTA
ncbi:MAG: hypothetical protein HYV62_00925 [Candidatus Rokubacteria bacterium]|nr:hypothetical protein [Candidatus Rokubacteria bacterium]